jgi:N4-gp56 family major capsid protein
MTLPMDALVQKAITLSTNLTAIIPDLWAAQMEPNLRKAAVLEQALVQNTDLLGTDGDVVHIPTLPDLAAAAALTEGTDMTVAALTDATSIDLTPSEVGKAIGITRKALDRIKYDGMAAIVERLAYSMSLYIEGTIAALWDNDLPGASGSHMGYYYPNSHTSANVVVGDTFSSNTLLDAVGNLRASDVMPFPDGTFMAFIHPYQYRDLLKDTDVKNAIFYGSPQVMFRGEVGTLHNVRLIVTNHVVNVMEGASSLVATRKALLVSPRWAAVAWKRRPELVVDPTLYDFGRRRQVAVTADLDIQLLHLDRSLVITTAAAAA